MLRRYVRHSPDAGHVAEGSDGTESDNATVRSIHEVRSIVVYISVQEVQRHIYTICNPYSHALMPVCSLDETHYPSESY